MTFTRPRNIPRKFLALIVAVTVPLAGAVAVGAGVVVANADRETAASSVTIWGDAKPSGVTLDTDKRGVELGTTFTPTVNGQVTGDPVLQAEGSNRSTHRFALGVGWHPDGVRDLHERERRRMAGCRPDEAGDVEVGQPPTSSHTGCLPVVTMRRRRTSRARPRRQASRSRSATQAFTRTRGRGLSRVRSGTRVNTGLTSLSFTPAR